MLLSRLACALVRLVQALCAPAAAAAGMSAKVGEQLLHLGRLVVLGTLEHVALGGVVEAQVAFTHAGACFHAEGFHFAVICIFLAVICYYACIELGPLAQL